MDTTIMPVTPDPWTELGEFDQCEPSAIAFRAMVALLDTWPAEDQAAAIDAAEAQLASWPDAVRLAPWSWCKAASKGAVLPTWKLVRALTLKQNHLSKGTVDLARLAHYASLDQITELAIPRYSDFQERSFLYHHPEIFPNLKSMWAVDKRNDGVIQALADSPLWRTLERFEVGDLTSSLAHHEVSRIVPEFDRSTPIRHLTLRADDLIAAWDAVELPQLESAAVFIRSIDEAERFSRRNELSRLKSLSIAFRCGFSGGSSFEPFLGNIIEADEAAADVFFRNAGLDRLQNLAIIGYAMGYWGREGMGRLGLESLIASGLLQRVTSLRLELLPLGDKGITMLSPALGPQLETLELIDVYCKGDGALALVQSPCLPALKTLDLSGNRIDAGAFAQLAAVEMPHLQTLDLSGPGINPYYWNIGQQPLLDAGAIAWVHSPNARRLRHLRLQNCLLTDAALVAIFESPQLKELVELNLSSNSFTAAAIAGSVAGSALWQTLVELGLNHCRLDNGAIEALTSVTEAPALRLLDLGYNSIGVRGAAALADWPALARVWLLGLHDNFIGDEGLIALAGSAYVGRLLELDLEQDCWNSRVFSFSDHAAQVLADSKSLPRLDGLYSGCVDEYHGAAYSPGFSKPGLNVVRKSPEVRPACKAACSDFSGISDYYEYGPCDEEKARDESDFRNYPMALNDREAESSEQRIRQVSLPPGTLQKPREEPLLIQPVLRELDFANVDIIEGVEYRDPTPVTDIELELHLPLQDSRRPLPEQASKLVSDTLESIWNACSMGSLQGVSYGGSGTGYVVSLLGDPQPALQLCHEVLWWIGASAESELDDGSLVLDAKPSHSPARLLQLAVPVIARWKLNGKPGHRIDRVPLTPGQRERIRSLLSDGTPSETEEGWEIVVTGDGGRMAVCTRYLKDSQTFDTLNILAVDLTMQISGLVYRLMHDCELLLWPMAFAATETAAQALEGEWPHARVVPSASSLHQLLSDGPYHWWTNH